MKLGPLLFNVALIYMCLYIGNWMGDQATIRDCATKGEAVMTGKAQVKIKCEVEKK